MIFHRDGRESAADLKRHLDRRWFRRVLHGVVHQIAQRQCNRIVIGANRNRVRALMHLDAMPHAVRALTTPFTAYLHTGIARAAAPAIPPAKKTPTAEARTATVTGHRVTTHTLRLRSGPSTAAGVIATLAAHAKVGVVRLARDHAGRTWYRVLVGGRLGWVAGWFTRTAS